MSKTSSIDLGTPPETVRRQQEQLESLASAGVMTVEDSRAKNGKVADSVDPVPVKSAAEKSRISERVELEMVAEQTDVPVFRIAFNVGEVCIREHYISLLILSDLNFKPASTARFNLRYKGRTYPVIFAGAEFEFQTVGVRGISFLVDSRRQVEKPQ